MSQEEQVNHKEVVGESSPLWQVDGVPEVEEEKDDSRIFEANKRLKRMYESARARVEELEALVNPKEVFKIVHDCSEAELARRVSAGWEVSHQQFVPKGGMTHVLAVVFKKAADPVPPTPPGRLMVPVVSEASENRHSTKQEDDERDDRPAARVVEDVIVMPTMRIVGRGVHPDLPTFDKQKLNEIAVSKAMARVMRAMNGGNAS